MKICSTSGRASRSVTGPYSTIERSTRATISAGSASALARPRCAPCWYSVTASAAASRTAPRSSVGLTRRCSIKRSARCWIVSYALGSAFISHPHRQNPPTRRRLKRRDARNDLVGDARDPLGERTGADRASGPLRFLNALVERYEAHRADALGSARLADLAFELAPYKMPAARDLIYDHVERAARR